ncbi:MAG TPA: hypothetical protein VGY56_16935 [Verrucomicrobiae bacterium]|nr:hypothetical protein [Verrucomicrobiae bacterium]
MEIKMGMDTNAPTSAPTQTPPLASVFPKYAVLAFFLALLLVGMGVPRNWIWQEFLSTLHLQATYHNHGIQFLYYRDWHVKEHENENDAPNSDPPCPVYHLPSSTINLEGPNNAVITFALFDPSDPERLDIFANKMRTRLTSALNQDMTKTGPLEPIALRIHGANYEGLQNHFTVQPSMSSLTSRYEYFFLLRTATNKIMFTMQLPEESIDSPEIQLILDTLKLENQISPTEQSRDRDGADIISR